MAYEVTNKSTQHGVDTPHGFNTPHRFPVAFSLGEILFDQTKNLYPTGRAWYLPNNGDFESLHKAINLSYTRLIIDAKDTINSTFPDNDKFTEEDADLWEFRLGLISNSLIDLEIRKTAILRKLAYPANVQPRQHPFYIESQLQAAGFDVFIHENVKPFQTPEDIAAAGLTNVQHGGTTQHADSTQHGSGSFKVVANSLDPEESFNIGGDENLWATFFIDASVLGDMAEVPKERELEFRELVLKLKPAHTIAFLLINFV